MPINTRFVVATYMCMYTNMTL